MYAIRMEWGLFEDNAVLTGKVWQRNNLFHTTIVRGCTN